MKTLTSETAMKTLTKDAAGLFVASAVTKKHIAERRAGGDKLVTGLGGFTFSQMTGGGFAGAQLGCVRMDRKGIIIERDVLDGVRFATVEDADAYGLEAGLVVWHSAYKRALAAARRPVVAALVVAIGMMLAGGGAQARTHKAVKLPAVTVSAHWPCSQSDYDRLTIKDPFTGRARFYCNWSK